MILLIDNYDSFTYNLYQLCALFRTDIQIVRNNKITIQEISELQPSAMILSPGPKSPREAGICIELIQTFAPSIPILGVCLGMQAIGAAFGANIVKAPYPMHGKTSQVFHSRNGLYQGISYPMTVGRYHSLMVEKNSLSPVLVADSSTQDGVLMGVRHRDYPCFGVQFHPESILTEGGDQLVYNFFEMIQK